MGILTDDMQRVVREQRLGFHATVCADGTPNPVFEDTLAGWLEYVGAVTARARAILSSFQTSTSYASEPRTIAVTARSSPAMISTAPGM